MEFCHLHLHTTQSKLDGFGFPEDHAKKAKKLGFKYLACTDHGNIDGLIDFQKACLKEKIKPILGCEAYIIKDFSTKTSPRHITFWIKNNIGFKNLCTMLSIANLKGFYYRPRIDFQTLLKHCKGLIVGSACLKSFVTDPEGEILLKKLKRKLKDDIYLEVMPHDMDKQKEHNKIIKKLSKKYGIKIILTNDNHYIKPNDSVIQEIMLAIQSKVTWDNPNRWKFDITGLHLRSTKEMIEAAKKVKIYKKEYLTNTLEIAEKCKKFRIKQHEIKLPDLSFVNEEKEDKFLYNICIKNFKKIFGNSIKTNSIYYKRLKEEYKLIKNKKFSKYFLIVWDLCNWCRENNILIGPGRGSVGGSLIAYLLRITSVDPILHKLYFARFINKDRIDYPDIDIDFEDSKRHLVKEYLEKKYGEDNIAGVSSFNKMQAKASVQDVGRVFEVPASESIEFTKLIDELEQVSEKEKIDNAIINNAYCCDYAEKYPKVIKYAKKIAGQIRGYGQHAAALVISMDNISKSGRCNLIERNEVKMINWGKENAEYMGFMKLDVLGLKLLSILSFTLKLIKENHEKNIQLETLNLNDPKVLTEIELGNNTGVFQLNTYSMTSLVKEVGINSFRSIVDSIALVRPGPMNSGMTAQYIDRKHSGHWKKKNKIYEDITKDTYGVILFQEQVMEVIYKVAGLPYSTADKIRKIIGKKRDVKEFDKYEKIFFEGCKKTKLLSRNEAKEFWIGLHEHARYSFNLSHSVEYAILAYWCAWLKFYFPHEFICASLTFGASKKKPELMEEAYRLGLIVELPKVGLSSATEWMTKKGRLLIPFNEIKNFGTIKANKAANFVFTSQKYSNGLNKFFSKKNTKKKTSIKLSSIEKTLLKIGADKDITDPFSITDEVKELFDFRINNNPTIEYKNLYKLYNGALRIDKLDYALNGKITALKELGGISKVQSFKGYDFNGEFSNDLLFQCNECNLRKECLRPIAPSPGKLNVMIIGEAPKSLDDQKKKGFVGKNGDILWNLLKHKRDYFHITHVNKCFPKKSRKPNSNQIKICSKFLNYEIEKVKPCLILAFGNTSLEYFEGKTKGITSISGQVKWLEKYSCWIIYCIHPASTIYDLSKKPIFNKAIKKFTKLFEILAQNNLKNKRT